MPGELREIARLEVPPGGAPWRDALLELDGPAWIGAAYSSGLVTHGAQLAPAGLLRLRALPALDGEGLWIVVADRPVGARVRLEPRQPHTPPAFEPSPSCRAGCQAEDSPEPVIRWERHAAKALAYPATGEIVIDPTWWASLESVGARLAVLAHELGHLLGARCQTCADYHAGRWLASLGLSYRDAVRGLDATVSTRPAAAELVRGALHG